MFMIYWLVQFDSLNCPFTLPLSAFPAFEQLSPLAGHRKDNTKKKKNAQTDVRHTTVKQEAVKQTKMTDLLLDLWTEKVRISLRYINKN